MARIDAIVLGAGIVGTSVGLHLAKRGLAVALVDRRAPGEETSYGNAGVIEGNTVFPPAFPSDPIALLRIALKRAPEANYHLSFLPQVAPWLLQFRAASRPERLVETARLMRPLFARAVAEHEALLAEAGAERYLRKTGWLKLYRSDRAFDALKREFALAQEFGMPLHALDPDGARELEPSLAPVFRHAVFWPLAASVADPLAVTKAYAARFAALGGVVVRGNARSLHRANACWRVETAEGPLDAAQAVVALGPFAPDVLSPLGITLPLAVKRGYHRHYRGAGNAALARPVVDMEIGYCLAPMDQGLFPLGESVETTPWMGSRPCFADSRPVIGRAPGQSGLWLAYGHAHWGLTLGPATGRLLAEMMTGATPFCDPAPYGAERFGR